MPGIISAALMSNKSTSHTDYCSPMTRRHLSSFIACSCYAAVKSRASAGLVPLILGGAIFAASPYCIAQIPQDNGAAQQERRTSAMGATPDPAASAVHESFKPQTKDGGSATSRGKTGTKDHKTQGAGGFDNGLYGTGAGSNK
jgi:hypothetical protein